jgi:hypothetical protein
MWLMPTGAPLFITGKWAITTETFPMNASLQADDLEPSKTPRHNLIQQIHR